MQAWTIERKALRAGSHIHVWARLVHGSEDGTGGAAEDGAMRGCDEGIGWQLC